MLFAIYSPPERVNGYCVAPREKSPSVSTRSTYFIYPEVFTGKRVVSIETVTAPASPVLSSRHSRFILRMSDPLVSAVVQLDIALLSCPNKMYSPSSRASALLILNIPAD